MSQFFTSIVKDAFFQHFFGTSKGLVVRDVDPEQFRVFSHAQEVYLLQDEEQQEAHPAGPSCNDGGAQQLGADVGQPAREFPPVERVRAKRLGAEQAGGYRSSEPAQGMHRDADAGVVDMEHVLPG